MQMFYENPDTETSGYQQFHSFIEVCSESLDIPSDELLEERFVDYVRSNETANHIDMKSKSDLYLRRNGMNSLLISPLTKSGNSAIQGIMDQTTRRVCLDA